MTDRHFFATALGGRLYVQGLAAHASWDRRRLVLYPEKQVEVILGGDPTRRKLLTVEQLVAVVHESSAGLRAIPLFVHETLEDTAAVCGRALRASYCTLT